jgi:hypothetical protein
VPAVIDYATNYCLAVTIGPTSRAQDAVACLHAAIAEAERVTGLDDLRDDRTRWWPWPRVGLTFESGCSQLRADHGDDLGDPEAPEVQGNPAQSPGTVSSSDRSHRRTRKFLKEIREAVSDRGSGVRSRGERPPTRGAPKEQNPARRELRP